jgi:hypothetical protein
VKKRIAVAALASTFVIFAVLILSGTEQEKTRPVSNFYDRSLHATARGLEYWYGKDQGGLERLTGIPFSKLHCGQCHVESCDPCHKVEAAGTAKYSLEPAKAQEVCQACHGLEPLDFARKNPKDPIADVHFSRGMKCLDCHTQREVHGDGIQYDSLQQEGAMDSRCENCHTSLSQCASHTVHGGKLDCNVCHVRNLQSCYNCHFDTRVREGKSVSVPLQNLLFLVNLRGRVALANLHTFVYKNQGMITFGPSFPHSVMKEGRTCPDCHGTQVVRDIQENKFVPVVFEKGELKNAKGIVPVTDALKWKLVFLNYENGKWAPIENPGEPLINFSGYCGPLTPEQLSKLAKAETEGRPSPNK